VDEHSQLGVRALKLLAELSMISILWSLADGSMSAAQIDRVLPEAGQSVVKRQLHKLVDNGLVQRERRDRATQGAPAHGEGHYELTEGGRALLDVAGEAAHWERAWGAQSLRGRPAGSGAVALMADLSVRRIMTTLADGALDTRALELKVSGLGRPALRRRLCDLALAGLLEQRRFGQSRRYELTLSARRLTSVAMLAGRWEWRWMRPESLRPGSDLTDLLRMLAPAARLPEPVAGICQLRLEMKDGDDADIYLAVHGGSVRALARAPTVSPQAVGRATPDVWCDTLLTCEGAISASGDERLLTAIVEALNTALTG
jgi:DNA-binding HxlR family transcriptional regulator